MTYSCLTRNSLLVHGVVQNEFHGVLLRMQALFAAEGELQPQP